jgi:FkbM family methyltransferase
MEAQELKHLSSIFAPAEKFTVLEVGGYDFSDTIQIRGLFPGADIYSLESHKVNIDSYAHQAHYHRIIWDWYAASDYTGTIQFYPSVSYGKYGTWTGSGSIILPEIHPDTDVSTVYPDLKFDLEGAEVPCITIDDYCEMKGIKHIDWFRIDAQGAEYKILSALEKSTPTFIWAEHCEFATYQTGVTIQDFDDMLAEKGYAIVERMGSDTLYKNSKYGI